MSVNLNSSLINQHFLLKSTPSLEGASLERLSNLIPQEWVQAGFCNQKGELQLVDNFKEVLPDDLLNQLLNKTITIGQRQISLREYLDVLLLAFPNIEVELCLRGSYGSYLLGVDRHLKILVDHFTDKFPEYKQLMAEGLSKIKRQLIRSDEPDDVDFALYFKRPIGNLELIKKELIKLNSQLGNLSFIEAKDCSFNTLFVVKPNDWCKLEDQIVIASLYGDAKFDITIGHMAQAPYLFSMDNHAIILKEGKWHLGAISGSPWQSFVDRAAGIVRIEKRHSLDFRALLRAVILLSRGAEWDTSPATVSDYLAPYLAKTAAEISVELNKKLDDPRVEPVSFIVNFLSLVADANQRQGIWQELRQRFYDFDASYEKAIHQIAEQARAYPELYGAMPLLKIPADKPLPARSLAFMKTTLFMNLLSPPDDHCTGIYAEWRRCCYLLYSSESRPEEIFDRIGEMFLKGLLEPAEQDRLARLLKVESLVDALAGHCTDPELIKRWLVVHEKQSWLEKLPCLPRQKGNLGFVNSLLTLVEGKAELIVAALQLKYLPLTTQTQELIQSQLLEYPNDQVVVFLNAVGSKVESNRKDWVIDLWIFSYQNGKLELPLLQVNTKKWLESAIPADVKSKISLALFRSLGSAPFHLMSRSSLAGLFAEAAPEEKEQIWLEILESDPSQAALFFAIHEQDLRPQLSSLFERALPLKLGSQFVVLFKNENALHDLFYRSLNRIPEEERLGCARALPQQLRLLLANERDLLSQKDRHALQLDLLMETKSILLLWKWQKENSTITLKIESLILTAFAQSKAIQIDEDELQSMIFAGDYEQIAQLLRKLPEERQLKTIEKIQQKWDCALENGNLRDIREIAACPELLRQMPLRQSLKVEKSQLPELLTMIKTANDYKLKSLFCQGYLAVSEPAEEPFELYKQAFSLLPHFPWRQNALQFLRAIISYPLELHSRFQSIEEDLLKEETIPGELITCYFLSLHQKNLEMPSLHPQKLIAFLTENPVFMKDSAFIFALLKKCSHGTFLTVLMNQWITLGELSLFEDWLRNFFQKLNDESQAQVIELMCRSPLYVDLLLKVSRTCPKAFNNWSDLIVKHHIRICSQENRLCLFSSFEHFKIKDWNIVHLLVDTQEGLVANGSNLLRHFRDASILSSDQKALLVAIVRSAIDLGFFDLLENHRALLEKIKDLLDIKPVEKALLTKQLNDPSGSIEWLSCAETFEERVKALDVLILKPHSEDLFNNLIAQVAEELCMPSFPLQVADLETFLRLFKELYKRGSETTKEALFRGLNRLMVESQGPRNLSIKSSLLVIELASVPAIREASWERILGALQAQFDGEAWKELYFIALKDVSFFNHVKKDLLNLFESNHESMEPKWREFFELRIGVEDEQSKRTENNLKRLCTLARDHKIDLTEAPHIDLFARYLYDIACPDDRLVGFPIKLRDLAIITASTVAGQNLRQALPRTVERLIVSLLRQCSPDDEKELGHVMWRLGEFFKNSLQTTFQFTPDEITHLGRSILYESISHPQFGCTALSTNLDFFFNLNIKTQEKRMIYCLMNSLVMVDEWSNEIFKYEISTEVFKITLAECFKLIMSRSSRNQKKWIISIFYLLYSQQTAQLDLDLLRTAIPVLIPQYRSIEKMKSSFKEIFDMRGLGSSKTKAFFDEIDQIASSEFITPELPLLSSQDFFQLADKINAIQNPKGRAQLKRDRAERRSSLFGMV